MSEPEKQAEENIVKEEEDEKKEVEEEKKTSTSSDVYIPQTIPEKIDYSEQLKKEGSEFYKKGEIKKALKKYKMIFLYLRGLDGNLASVMSSNTRGPAVPAPGKDKDIPEDERKVKSLMIAANLNIALCYVKIGKGKQARRYAGRVLEHDVDNTKAIFRRGQGWMIDGFVENAKSDFMKVLEKFPNDQGVKRALIQLKKKRKEVLKKEKKMYKNMKFE